ncbi:uncharacterized protein [Primulina eburnea]|uniref:uncharacterized protein n=1 Tax=Primulina eburnea TaxID=1245227 RepID=UPI003C6CB7C0
MPADEMHVVIKPWPFQGWAMGLIDKIYPPSSKGHSFIIVATDFFTKWVEALPMKKVEQKDVIVFVKEHIIHRFGIPQSITTDQGTMFVVTEMKECDEEYWIQLINSSHHYPKSNGQVETSNQVLIKMLKKMMEDNPRDWHQLLSELCGLTGHRREVLLLEDLDELRMQTYNALILQKSKVARSYNKHVHKKIFEEGDVVWKVILPLGSKDRDSVNGHPIGKDRLKFIECWMEMHTGWRVRMVSHTGGASMAST